MTLLRLLSRTKLYWGLLVIVLIGVAFSPLTGSGKNIFLSYGNLTDVLRQVSITGLAAVGMTVVILIAGIDLSVGSVMAFGTVLTATLLTEAGWTSSATIAVPAAVVVAFAAAFLLVRFVGRGLRRTAGPVGARHRAARDPLRDGWIPGGAGLVLAGLVALWLLPQVEAKFGVAALLVAVPCAGLVVGAVSGAIIVAGRLQPFIVTLAMMVGLLGLSRLTAGQDSAVLPVYAGTNATEDIELLRSMLWGVLPVPGLFFLAAVAVFAALLRLTVFGRYVYAIGGNEEAARLSGIPVDRVKIAAYAFSGMLSTLAGILYVAQYRQGKPDAGAGLELDAIAAVVIGGTSLMGGRGAMAGTLVGVLIFGLLSNILQLHNINSNLQLVFKGAIIIVTVLLQERNLADLLAPFRTVRTARRDPAARSEAAGQQGSSLIHREGTPP
jgi:simple sugar transport system permease protein